MPDNDNPIRFGIIGCAKIAGKVSRAIILAPGAALVAIASRNVDKAQQFAAQNQLSEDVKLYGSYEELVEDPSVDAVYVPLPTSLHTEWVARAAPKGKHVLLEKPTSVDAKLLDEMLRACEANRVQFMDASTWYHHPRTSRIKEFLSDSDSFGRLQSIHSSSSFRAPAEFLENDIRVKPDLDALGALGDTGWYCIGAILWTMNRTLPTTVTALPPASKNSAGVILSCSASLHWVNQDTIATFHCSFVSHATQDLAVCGSKGTLHVEDFIIPYDEKSASFRFTSGAEFVDLHIGWNMKAREVEVVNGLPQEALMVEEFARLVKGIRDLGLDPETKWGETSLATQMVVDAVKKSIDDGYKVVKM